MPLPKPHQSVNGCRCEQCCPANPDPKLTEKYRHECEVRAIVNMPSNEHRAKFLKAVAARRGDNAAQRLRLDAWKIISGATS